MHTMHAPSLVYRITRTQCLYCRLYNHDCVGTVQRNRRQRHR